MSNLPISHWHDTTSQKKKKLIETEMARQEELKKTYTDPSSAPTEVIHSDNSQEEE